MVENIKITAREIKRTLKLSIYLPKHYNENNNSYPLVYAFDGQMMFHSLDDNDKTFDLPSILDDINAECICIGLHSPKIEAWRLSELCPYYNGNNNEVDTVYSTNYINYISKILHPLLKERYRINENVYLLGFNEGAFLSIYGAYHDRLFKGAGLFSPSLEMCKGMNEDINNNFDKTKAIYMYYGQKNTEYSELFYELYKFLEGLQCEKLKLSYEPEEENNYRSWQKFIADFFKFIL